MEEIYCQSCGMPLRNPEEFGTTKDGAPAKDYCCYCFKDGDFVHDYTMEEMISHCATMVEQFNADSGMNLTREQAVDMMREYFPKLKRWERR